MKQNLFARFAPTIRDLEICDLDDRLLLDRDGPVSVYYAPFDYINGDAKPETAQQGRQSQPGNN